MKKLLVGFIGTALMLMFSQTIIVTSVYAQLPAKTGNANKQMVRPRDLFIEHAANQTQGLPGAKVRILLQRNGKQSFVTTNETFYEGDKVKLVFNTNFDGYVALLNLGSSGKYTLLYPYKDVDPKIQQSAETKIPARENDWIKFDDKAGKEQITVIFSTNPIDSVQQVLNAQSNNGGKPTPDNGSAQSSSVSVNTTTTVTTTNNSNGSTVSLASSTDAQAILAELNSRSLKHSGKRDLSIETVNNDATYAVGSSSLVSEPTAFVINLNHQKR